MSWSGPFAVKNETGAAIYNLCLYHTYSIGNQGPEGEVDIINVGTVNAGSWVGGGTWVTTSGQDDYWEWDFNVFEQVDYAPLGFITRPTYPSEYFDVNGAHQCNIESEDTEVLLYIQSGGVAIHPNVSSNCWGVNDS